MGCASYTHGILGNTAGVYADGYESTDYLYGGDTDYGDCRFRIYTGVSCQVYADLLECDTDYPAESSDKSGCGDNGISERYELKTLKIYYSEEHKGFNHDDYSFYAPVMCYETDSSEKESVSRVFSQDFKWEKETEYPICYSAVNPEIFWFPEQKAKLTLPYLVGLCISAVIFVGVLVFYFSI